MLKKDIVPTWISALSGAILGVISGMSGALIAFLIFHLADSQFFALFTFFPVLGFLLGLVSGFTARKLSKKHPEQIWIKRLGIRIAIIFAVSFLLAVPMSI